MDQRWCRPFNVLEVVKWVTRARRVGCMAEAEAMAIRYTKIDIPESGRRHIDKYNDTLGK